MMFTAAIQDGESYSHPVLLGSKSLIGFIIESGPQAFLPLFLQCSQYSGGPWFFVTQDGAPVIFAAEAQYTTVPPDLTRAWSYIRVGVGLPDDTQAGADYQSNVKLVVE
jgi:hypothetical protein